MLFIRFLSTPSARRATRKEHSIAYRVTISIHALREEGDGGFDVTVSLAGNFYPRPPRGGRPSKAGGRQRLFDISIHALREEGDSKLEPISSLFSYFYPRPPRGGRLGVYPSQRRRPQDFYPRPPRGGRHYHNDSELSILDFYPRPPRGGRQRAPHRGADADPISIHALREEGDRLTASSPTRSVYFYPRPPRGGRPRSSTCRPRAESISIHALREEGDLVPPCVPQIVHGISIHALREEGDAMAHRRSGHRRDFYPRPPRGGRPN